MLQCHVCGSTECTETIVNEVFEIDNTHVLVEHIPASLCRRCGERIFSRETTENVRRLVHGEGLPSKLVSMNVFEYA